ncbi:MAG: cell division protein FtsB [Gammaproteobacteria bacterium]
MLKLRLLAVILVALIAVLQYRLWVSEDGLPAIQRLSDKIDAQALQNEQLRTRNERLEAEVRDLKAGLEAVEERARRELGMIAEDETFYQFVEPPRTNAAQPRAPGGVEAREEVAPPAAGDRSATVEAQ